MNKSESIKNLAAALSIFQSQISTVHKNKTVKVKTRNGGEYTFPYADFEAIRTAIKEPLKDNGLSFVQPISSEGVTTVLMHSSGEYIGSTIQLNLNQTPQELGSEITYKKRYALSAILGLSTDDDDDGNIASGNSASPANNTQDDNKPWYNAFDDEKEFMRQRLQQGETNQGLIDYLSQTFKISKETRQKIMELK